MGNSMSIVGKAAQVAIAVALPWGLGALAGRWALPELESAWYKKLKKPTWNPPAWLFAIVWPIWLSSQGVASYLVFRKGVKEHALALSLYTTQMLLNTAWFPIFLKGKRLGVALATNLTLDALVYATIYLFAPIIGTPATAGLLGPYASWITFATVLSAYLYLNNPDAKPDESEPLLDTAAATPTDAAATKSS